MDDLLQNQAEAIVARFPSRSALAEALGHRNHTTIQRWIDAGYIRPKHYEPILTAAKSLGVTLTRDDFAVVRGDALETFFDVAA